MEKISIKKIIEFKSKSDKSKKKFVETLKTGKTKDESEGGGDYWVSCLSAISNSYKKDKIQLTVNKRIELEEKHEETAVKKTKTMYKRNIDILYDYEKFDLKKWKPSKRLQFLKKYKVNSILTIKGLPIQVAPQHVFSFQKNDVEEVGAIWFIAKLNGYKKDELGMFADALFQYLKRHYSEKYFPNARYCIAVDVFNKFDINFFQLEKGLVPSILNSTLDEIKRLM